MVNNKSLHFLLTPQKIHKSNLNCDITQFWTYGLTRGGSSMIRPTPGFKMSIYPHQLNSYFYIQGAHAGIIRSYFRFHIYKAIRKVLFLPSLAKRSYKGLIFGSKRNFNSLNGLRSIRGNIILNTN